jgi:hypothetical protein
MSRRPDGVVAWVSKPIPELDEFEQAASRWFGQSQKCT